MVGIGIKRLREARSITQEELAKKLGVSRQAICMWETERREIKATMLNKIARILGTTADEMIKSRGFKNIGKEERNMRMGSVKRYKDIGKDIEKKQKKVKFELMAPEANEVLLTGDFNSWDENGIALRRDRNGIWRTSMNLNLGRYEYKFIVDGQWWTDPANTESVTNTYGSQNSVITVTS